MTASTNMVVFGMMGFTYIMQQGHDTNRIIWQACIQLFELLKTPNECTANPPGNWWCEWQRAVKYVLSCRYLSILSMPVRLIPCNKARISSFDFFTSSSWVIINVFSLSYDRTRTDCTYNQNHKGRYDDLSKRDKCDSHMYRIHTISSLGGTAAHNIDKEST